MGERTRSFDWSKTAVGPISQWPQSLKIVVRTMLDSRYAMWLGWGPEFTFFYNDAYARMTLGPKHPWALGRSAREVWSEIWADIGPRAESVVHTGRATWDEGLLLFLERRGFPEETYHTFSYSPVPDDDGRVGGMLCVVTEDTERTIGERRLRTIRELAARTNEVARSVEEACQTTARTLTCNPQDLPFVLLYLLDDDERHAKLVGLTGLDSGGRICPSTIDLNDSRWPFRQVSGAVDSVVVDDLDARFGPISAGPWPEPIRRAAILPVAKPGQPRPAGFIVAGISSRLIFNDGYKGFLDLIASHIATAIANARVYEEERRRAEALAELDRAKTAFFSNVSHEFRTPLALMLGPLEDVLGRSTGPTPIVDRESLEVIHRNGVRLQRLVNALLEFSRIEAGRVQAAYQPTDLAAFTIDLASNFRSACERAGLRLTVDCPPLTAPVFVDRSMWEKIVLNLLSNALKFTFRGEIAVNLRQTGASVELQVRDTGTGIPAEEMPRLFERFHRIENARGRTHEGSGIGLALVQELVKLHGGSITAQSVPGEGTTFHVQMPLGSAHLPADQIGDEQAQLAPGSSAGAFVDEAMRWLAGAMPEASGNGDVLPEPWEASQESASARPGFAKEGTERDRPRILIADDNADMRQYISRLLTPQYQTEAVADGESAWQAALEHRPDLIVTDVMMPRLDGFGLLRRLRADPKTGDVPIIMLSARAGEESRVEGMEGGADDYLVKPFSARELMARVTAHLQLARVRREAGESLRQSQERLRIALTAARMVAWQLDPGTGHIVLSENAAEVLGLPKDCLPERGDEALAFLHPEDVDRHREEVRKVIAEGGSYVTQFRVVRGDNGEVVWVEERGIAVSGEAGRKRRIIGVVLDITERKQTEQRLRDATAQSQELAALNAKFRTFFEQGSYFAGVMTPDGTLIEANRLSLEACGFARAEVIGRKFWDCGWWNRSPSLMELIHEGTRQAAEGSLFRRETSYFLADGTQRMVDLILAPVKDESGKVLFIAPTGTDITDRKRGEESNSRLAAIVESSDDAIISKDLAGVIRSWNAGAARLFGYSPEEAIGRSITMLIPHDRLAEESDILERIRRGDRVDHFETVRRRKDGTLVEISLTVSPITDDRGKVVGASKIARDITDRKRAERTLLDADRQKNEFLATLAHELRNPLAPIRNSLNILRLARADGPAAGRVLEMMERQVDHMVRLVDDLLEISRITTGKIELRLEPVEIAAVIRSAVETSRPLIEAGGHQLATTLPAEPLTVDGDPVRLSQVVANLLNNAAKYTEPGGQIWLSASREGAEVAISVRDTGIGISADFLPRVLEMFFQADRTRKNAQDGLGIGLALVKRLVEMHGGRIEAKSEGEGRGSEFILRLPLALKQLPPADARRNVNRDPRAGSRQKILVVDDNRDAASSLAMLLKILGNDVRTAHDGQSALAAFVDFQPSLVLLDLGLPDISGYDVAGRMRELPQFHGVMLVALTGWGQDEDRRRTQEAGFDQHLVKPVNLDALQILLTDMERS